VNGDDDNFRVIDDDHGEPVRCAYCARGDKRVAVLPLTGSPELDGRFRATDGAALCVALFAYCVLGLGQAYANAEGKLP
jgi:hypothetical protein